MDTKALPMGGYVRVSVVGGRSGDTFMSPDLQRDSIEGWAKRAGATLDTIREELDVSGGARNRPGLEWLVAETEAGRLGGIVVAKIDRFTRNVAYGADVIERVVAAGGTVIGADDGTDARTRNGRLMVQMMMAIGEHQLEGYREGTRASQAKMIAQGKHVGPYAPAGYLREGGYLKPDPHWGPVMRDVFVRLASGHSVAETVAWLNDLGLTTGRGGTITARWLSNTVRNRVYLGEVSHGEHTNIGTHEPLVDELTWKRVGRARRPRSPSTGGVLLTGLVRCAGCGYVMGRTRTPPYADGKRRDLWFCARKHAGGICQAPATGLDQTLSALVLDAFWRHAEQAQARTATDDAERDALEREAATARRDFDAYRDTPGLIDAIGPDEYTAGLTVRRSRMVAAQSALDEAAAPGPEATDVVRLRAVWPSLPLGAQRAALSAEFAAIVVSRPSVPRSHTEALSSRAAILLTGWEPDDIPRPGRSGQVAPIEIGDPPDAWLSL
jgi:DNA invertase Pin-like site-specific DNA recombinase